MTDKELEAEALVRLAQSSDGQHFMRWLTKEFDDAMKKLLFAKPDEIYANQGHARGLESVLRKFSTAHQTVNAKRG